MNTAPLAFALSMLLLSRLFFYYPEKTLHKKFRFLKISAELLLLVPVIFQFSQIWFPLIVLFVNGMEQFVEERYSKVNKVRLAGFLMLLLGSVFFANLSWNPFVLNILNTLPDNIWLNLAGKIQPACFWWVFLGWLISLNETNIFLRQLLKLMNLTPLQKEQPQILDEQQYNRGRIIGLLERTAVFFLVFFGQYATIGLLLTAKGITRYKKLEERDFAEYFLIGTLLSTLAAVGLALIIRYILKILC